MRPPAECQSMAEVRSAIDALDQEVVHLLAQRATYIDRASALKLDNGWPARIPDPGQTHEIFIQENYGINSPNTGDKRGEFVKSIPDQSPIGIFWPYRPSVQGIGAFMRLP